MNIEKFNEAAKRLESWSKTLVNHINSGSAEIREVLNGKTSLPAGCPSKESLAALCMRPFASDIVEIRGAYDDMEAALWEK